MQLPTLEKENIPRGMLWMICTMFLFVTMDTVAKHLSQTYPVFQVVWARFAFHLITVAILFRSQILQAVRSRNLKLQLIRSCLIVLTTFLFFTGLSRATLATATTMMFLSPIYVTLLSIPILGETVGLRRWLGVLAGFTGALIIIRPGSDAFDSASLFLLAAPLCNALYQLMTREARKYDSENVTLLYTAVVGVLLTSATLPFNWVTPDASAWVLLALTGALGCISHLCLIRAFRSAPASAVVPLSYTSLIWATLYGYILFDNLPDGWTLTGAAIIVTSGAYIFFREHQISNLDSKKDVESEI